LKQVVVLEDAEDLEAARDFYNAQEPGVGEYFVDSKMAICSRSQRKNLTHS
jgi:hypothetical protein